MTEPPTTKRPIVVLSFDGLSRDSIGAMGCGWNQTPAIDAIAASGLVFDRCILRSDRKRPDMNEFWQAENIVACGRTGATVLVTDDPAVEDQGDDFDLVVCETPDGPPRGVDDDLPLEQTRLGQLYVRAIEAVSSVEEVALLWIHASALLHHWDAPSSLAPVGWGSDDDESSPADDEDESLSDAVAADAVDDRDRDPFDGTVPRVQLDDESDPDEAGRWMQFYGRQVRLIDVLIEILLASLPIEDPRVVVLSTGGFALGQQNHIGYRRGPIRSNHIHVPLIVSDFVATRWPHLVSPDQCIGWILSGVLPDDAGRWLERATEPDEAPQKIVTASSRADAVVTTEQWFAIRENDGSEFLFVKPDDLHDVNNVASRRLDIVDELLPE